MAANDIGKRPGTSVPAGAWTTTTFTGLGRARPACVAGAGMRVAFVFASRGRRSLAGVGVRVDCAAPASFESFLAGVRVLGAGG